MKLGPLNTFIRNVKTFAAQFGIFDAIRFACAEVTRKALDPYNIASYSQTGEDRILCTILGDTGFYVDVGCNHPQFYSNTFGLYKRGWAGITIDANDALIQKHQKLRKRDLSLCAAVSDHAQELIFTDFEDALVSSLSTEHVNAWQAWRKIKGQRVVNTVSLTTLLAGHQVPNQFDLLSIDVEGHDYEVLSSLDLTLYRPKLIVIEMHEFDLLNPGSNKIYEYLSTNHYKLIGYVVMNGYFADTLPQPSAAQDDQVQHYICEQEPVFAG
ncbi:MAG: FkbM family methyltransferase [Caldilineaceae bacterium]